MRYFLYCTCLFVSTLLLGKAPGPAQWQEDFQQILQELAKSYANLQDIQQHRSLDLLKLVEQTRKQLKTAHTQDDFQHEVNRFLSSFQDGHLKLRATKTQVNGKPPRSLKDLPTMLGAPHPQISILVPRQEGKIPAGLYADRTRVGIIEVPSFQSSLASSAQLIAMLNAAVKKVAAEKPAALLIDVTYNGGGQGTPAAALARMLSAPGIWSPRFSKIKGPDTAMALEEQRARLPLTAQADPLGQRLLKALDQLIQEARQPCDLMPMWRGQAVSCRLTLQAPMWSDGLLPYLPRRKEPPSAIRQVAFGGLEANYTEALFTGPLFVLQNRKSGSATELLVAMLKDGRPKVTVIGEASGGSGCGTHRGNHEIEPVVLKHSRLRLHMPNCSRYRKDGSNEVLGIEADIPLPVPTDPRAYDSFRERVLVMISNSLALGR